MTCFFIKQSLNKEVYMKTKMQFTDTVLSATKCTLLVYFKYVILQQIPTCFNFMNVTVISSLLYHRAMDIKCNVIHWKGQALAISHFLN
jgi:hypothetical protein